MSRFVYWCILDAAHWGLRNYPIPTTGHSAHDGDYMVCSGVPSLPTRSRRPSLQARELSISGLLFLEKPENGWNVGHLVSQTRVAQLIGNYGFNSNRFQRVSDDTKVYEELKN